MAEEVKAKEDSNSKIDYPFDKMVELHQSFLKAVKETSPLAVLGSLSIAVSAFTQTNYSQVQSYAVAAATMFLIAFVISLFLRMFSNNFIAPMLVLSSFIATVLAVLMLFVIVYEFSKNIPVVGNTVATILPLLMVTICSSVAYYLWNVRGKVNAYKSSFLSLTTKVAILSLLLSSIFGVFEAGNFFFKIVENFNIPPELWKNIRLLIYMFSGFSAVLLTLTFSILKNKSSNQSKVNKIT